jgi:hypothetical protein
VQTSFVQAIPSEVQVAPSALLVVVQPPVPSQAEEAWQSAGVQVYAAPPQAPFVQTSAFVHALPSSQVVPFAAWLHAVRVTAGWHDWHALPGVGVFAA